MCVAPQLLKPGGMPPAGADPTSFRRRIGEHRSRGGTPFPEQNEPKRRDFMAPSLEAAANSALLESAAELRGRSRELTLLAGNEQHRRDYSREQRGSGDADSGHDFTPPSFRGPCAAFVLSCCIAAAALLGPRLVAVLTSRGGSQPPSDTRNRTQPAYPLPGTSHQCTRLGRQSKLFRPL